VQNTEMPTSEELPPTLARLARRNALELSDRRWRSEVHELIGTLETLRLQRMEQARRELDEREAVEAEPVSNALGRAAGDPTHGTALDVALPASPVASEAVAITPDDQAAATEPAADAASYFWFYVEEPQHVVSPYDHVSHVATLQPGHWYLAGEENGDWVYVADERGVEGWVPLRSIRRYA
jgi:hypothetical protein